MNKRETTHITPSPSSAKSATPVTPSVRMGDFSSLIKVVKSASIGGDSSLETRRLMLRDFCKLFGDRVAGKADSTPKSTPISTSPAKREPLPKRVEEVLELLLTGKSEKEVARALSISIHTVHVHVKTIYKRLGVTSRGELMAKCLGGGGV